MTTGTFSLPEVAGIATFAVLEEIGRKVVNGMCLTWYILKVPATRSDQYPESTFYLSVLSMLAQVAKHKQIESE